MKTRKENKITVLRILFFALCFMALSINPQGRHTVLASAGSMQILPADVSQASSDCVLVGIEGSFVTQVQDALDRINEIRYEACREGVPSPGAPDKALTVNDYVPIEWSSGLEYIARLRAAEAIVRASHTRPNGEICFSLKAPDGTSSFGEVLAWHSSIRCNMVDGINMWYEEKADWVAQNKNAVTGHYTSMINPQNRYVGLGAFVSEYGVWGSSISGEFGTKNSSGKEEAGSIENCIQTIEVQKSSVQGLRIFADGEAVSEYEMGVGKKEMSARLKVVIDGDISYCSSLDELKWATSDASVADVDASGAVTAKKAGKAVISASAGGQSASCTVTVVNAAQPDEPDEPDRPDAPDLPDAEPDTPDSPNADADLDLVLSQEIFQYNGAVQKPKVTVYVDGKAVTSGYTVKYSKGCKKVGIYTVTAKMAGEYSGTVSRDFLIIPKGTSIKSAAGGSGSITVRWKKQTKQTDGYILYISDTKTMDGSGMQMYVFGNQNVKQVIGQLDRKQTYYVRIRTYKEIDGNAVCSEWSKAKKVKTK